MRGETDWRGEELRWKQLSTGRMWVSLGWRLGWRTVLDVCGSLSATRPKSLSFNRKPD